MEHLTLRDYFAARAMQGAIAEGGLQRIADGVQDECHQEAWNKEPRQIALIANRLLANMVYEIADAMIAAREDALYEGDALEVA